MKKVLIIVFFCALLFCLFWVILFCFAFPELFYKYDGWREINIENFGSFKCPSEWSHYISGNLIHFVDENNNPVMIETHSFSYNGDNFTEQYIGKKESNDFYSDVQNISIQSSSTNSVGAGPGKMLLCINGKMCDKYYLRFFNHNSAEIYKLFVVYDDNITEKLLSKIAGSFCPIY